MEKDSDSRFFDQFRTRGQNASEHRLQLLYAAIQNNNLTSDQMELIEELLAFPENKYFRNKRKNGINKHVQKSTHLSSSEIITAAQQIAALLDNEVGFAITSSKGTTYAGNFQPDAKKDIIYLQRPYSNNPKTAE